MTIFVFLINFGFDIIDDTNKHTKNKRCRCMVDGNNGYFYSIVTQNEKERIVNEYQNEVRGKDSNTYL